MKWNTVASLLASLGIAAGCGDSGASPATDGTSEASGASSGAPGSGGKAVGSGGTGGGNAGAASAGYVGGLAGSGGSAAGTGGAGGLAGSGGSAAGTGGAGGGPGGAAGAAGAAGTGGAGGGPGGAAGAAGAAGTGGSSAATCGEGTLLVSTVEMGVANSITGIAVDGTHVYYAWPGGIHRVQKAGGGPEKVVGAQSLNQGRIALDDTHVYWAGEWNSLRRAPKSGGTEELVVLPGTVGAPPPSQDLVNGLVVKNGVVVYGGATTGDSPGFVRAVAVTGGAVTSLYDGPDKVVVAGCSLPAVVDVQVLGPDAYFLHSCGAIAKAPIGGGAITLLGNPEPVGWGRSLAVGAASVHWTVPSGVNVLAAEGSAKLLALVPDARGLVLDGDTLYLTSVMGLSKLPSAGGDLQLLNALSTSTRVAVDDKSVYFAVSDSKTGIHGLCVRAK